MALVRSSKLKLSIVKSVFTALLLMTQNILRQSLLLVKVTGVSEKKVSDLPCHCQMLSRDVVYGIILVDERSEILDLL